MCAPVNTVHCDHGSGHSSKSWTRGSRMCKMNLIIFTKFNAHLLFTNLSYVLGWRNNIDSINDTARQRYTIFLTNGLITTTFNTQLLQLYWCFLCLEQMGHKHYHQLLNKQLKVLSSSRSHSKSDSRPGLGHGQDLVRSWLGL